MWRFITGVISLISLSEWLKGLGGSGIKMSRSDKRKSRLSCLYLDWKLSILCLTCWGVVVASIMTVHWSGLVSLHSSCCPSLSLLSPFLSDSRSSWRTGDLISPELVADVDWAELTTWKPKNLMTRVFFFLWWLFVSLNFRSIIL